MLKVREGHVRVYILKRLDEADKTDEFYPT